MKLFLSGGGSGEKSILLDKKFASSLDKSLPLLYIPIAIDKIKHPYPDCLDWISKVFNPLGITTIELWDEEKIKSKPEVNQYSGIYIGGGNTFYLLNELRSSGFLEVLKEFIELDVPIYGGSAGAIILGKSILTSSDQNKINLKDSSGLNLIGGYSLFCHYDKETDWVSSLSPQSKIKTIALPENSGLFVTDNKVEIIGPGNVFLPEKSEDLSPGDVLTY